MYEWTRIIGNIRVWLMMLLLIFVQIVGFWIVQLLEYGDDFGDFVQYCSEQLNDYRFMDSGVEEISGTVLERLNSMPAEELKNTGYYEIAFQEMINRQAAHIEEYESYLETVQKNAEKQKKLPIFSDKNTFAVSNIEKTAEDFLKVHTEKLRLCHVYAMKQILDLGSANWVLVFLFCIYLIRQMLEGKKQGLSAVLYAAPGGRGRLSIQRNIVFFVLLVLFAVFSCVSSVLVPLSVFGNWEDLPAAIQSLPEFKKCTISVTIGQFLVIRQLIQSTAVIFCGYLSWLICSTADAHGMSIAIIGIVCAVEYVMFEGIPENSKWVLFKGINIFSVLNAEYWFQHYLNVDVFGIPVNMWKLVIAVLVSCFFLMIFINTLYGAYSGPMKANGFWGTVSMGIRKKTAGIYVRGGLFWKEIDKFLRAQYGLSILIAAFVIFFFLNWKVNLYVNRDEYLLDYAKILNCGIDNKGEWQVPFGGYRLLFGMVFARHRQLKRLILLFLMACMVGNEAWENSKHMRKLTWATINGRRRLWTYKTVIWYMAVTILWVGLSASEVYWMMQSGGVAGAWEAPIKYLAIDLEQFEDMPIYGLAGIIMGFRLVALLAIAGIMQGVASFVDKKWYAVLVCTVVIVVPSGIFWIMGAEENSWSCLMLLDGILFWKNPAKYLICLSTLIFSGGMGGFISYYRWNHIEFLHNWR